MTTETTKSLWAKAMTGKYTRKVGAAIALDNQIGNTYSKWNETHSTEAYESYLEGNREKLREAMLKLTADEIDLLDTLIFCANENPNTRPNV